MHALKNDESELTICSDAVKIDVVTGFGNVIQVNLLPTVPFIFAS
jgi:hypothetical protein